MQIGSPHYCVSVGCCHNAAVAQSVERVLGKDEVKGSSPFSSLPGFPVDRVGVGRDRSFESYVWFTFFPFGGSSRLFDCRGIHAHKTYLEVWSTKHGEGNF